MTTISFRVSEAQKTELEARSEGNVSDYVKRVLFRQIEQQDMLNAILQQLESTRRLSPSDDAEREYGQTTQGIFVELLLLMRLSVKPETKRQAQAEVERLGLETWSSASHSNIQQGAHHGR